MKVKTTIQEYIKKANREVSLKDELARYLTGPWLDELTVEIEHEAKQWFWGGVAGGLVVGLLLGFLAGWIS